MGLPSLNLAFKTQAAVSINYSDKGTVAIIIRDAIEEGPHTLTRVKNIPSGLTAENTNYIKRAFAGNVTAPKKIILYVASADESGLEAGETGITAALDYMATQSFDYLVGPPDISAAEVAEVVDWVKDLREDGLTPKVILPDAAADSAAVINFTTKAIQSDSATYTNAAYASRIAGLIAGTPLKQSCTSAVLPEVTDISRLSKEEADAAIDAGEFILWHDGVKVKVGRGVNSLKTLKENQNATFKKIKIVEALDIIRSDLKLLIEDNYIGKYPNSYDNKCLLISAVTEYLETMAADDIVNPSSIYVGIDVEAQEDYLRDQGVDTSEMTEQDIKEAVTGERVFLEATVKIYDAIEDIDLNITV